MPTLDRNPAGTTVFGEVFFTPVHSSDASAWTGEAYLVARKAPSSMPLGGWLPSTAARCRQLFSLPAGWDGYSARQVDADLLQGAWNFAKAAALSVSTPPAVIPTATGGVALEWHARGIDLEIELTPTGVVVLLEDEEGEVEGPLREHASRVAAALSQL